jgi:hypothetical protein
MTIAFSDDGRRAGFAALQQRRLRRDSARRA